MTKRNWVRIRTIGVIAAIATLIIHTGCGKKASMPTPTSQVVSVAALLPLTGVAASLGEDEKLGIEMACSDYPGADKLLEYSFEDTKSKPDVTVSALRKQLDVDGTRVFVVSTTAPVQAALPALRDSGQDVLAFVVATMPDVAVGYPFAYRIYPTATEEVSALADFALKRGFGTVAGVAPRTRAGEEYLTMLRSQLEPHGTKVQVSETFEPTEKDLRPILLKTKAASVDAVFLVGMYPSQYPPLLKQLIEVGIEVPILCGMGMLTTGVNEEFPADFVERIAFVAPPFYFRSDRPETAAFIQAVQERGKVPNYEVGYAYDTATLLMRTIEKAGSARPQDIADAINQLVPFEGVTGSFTFNAKRDAVLGLRVCRWGETGIILAE